MSFFNCNLSDRNWFRRSSHMTARSRRRGVTIVYVALALFIFLGAAAISLDMSYLYARRAKAQRAADAAALAGAYQLSIKNDDEADTSALSYAAQNGYDSSTANVTVTTTKKWKGNDNWYHVFVMRAEPVFFAAIFGRRTINVGAAATAQYLIKVTIPIDPQYYGLKDGPITYSVFGPTGLHSNGDKYSVTKLNNGSANPEYDGKGYNFALSIPSNYKTLNGTSQVQVEIFDPDCHNKDNVADADSSRVDELRAAHSSGAGTTSDATTTKYSLIWDKDGNPNNPLASDHVTIASKSFGDDSTTDMKWNTPSGFTFDSSLYTTGMIRINATSTSGSSENGFNLRAGKPHSTDSSKNSQIDDATWHDQYSGASGTSKAGQVNGTSIGAVGNLPMNFNVNGLADIMLGYVPNTAAGGKFYITKFDTDVGAHSVYYTCDSLPGQSFSGVLSANDGTATDTLNLPSTYSGGNWYAHYDAGAQDTSSWSLAYDRGIGTPGGIKLVE